MAIVVNFKEFVNDLPIIEDPSIYKPGKTFELAPEGLYSEQIFGPIKNWSCACKEGGIKSSINKGLRCPECGVLCESNKLRSTQFAKINLPCYIILPPLIKNLYKIFGQSPIKLIMDKNKRQDLEKSPYYFPKNTIDPKLQKVASTTKGEFYLDYPVYDITTLYLLFLFLRSETTELEQYEKFNFMDYIFVDYVLVLPVNNRPVIKITNDKANVHPITTQYIKILKTQNHSFLDSLSKKNTETHGANVYRYQYLVNELYDIILQKNFQQKESVSRDYMMGKVIEHSGRLVIVPNPILRPYQIGLPQKSIKDINYLELSHYQAEKVAKESSDSTMIMDYAKKAINIFNSAEGIQISDEDFHEFILEKKRDLVYACERAPVLWKYNVTAFTLGFYTKDHNDPNRNMQEIKETNKAFNYRKSKKKIHYV
jgi:DNA-directed RNA polymerase beta' subunit